MDSNNITINFQNTVTEIKYIFHLTVQPNKLDPNVIYTVYFISNTYTCFSDASFSEFVEINEEFFNSNSILGNKSL